MSDGKVRCIKPGTNRVARFSRKYFEGSCLPGQGWIIQDDEIETKPAATAAIAPQPPAEPVDTPNTEDSDTPTDTGKSKLPDDEAPAPKKRGPKPKN